MADDLSTTRVAHCVMVAIVLDLQSVELQIEMERPNNSTTCATDIEREIVRRRAAWATKDNIIIHHLDCGLCSRASSSTQVRVLFGLPIQTENTRLAPRIYVLARTIYAHRRRTKARLYK